MFGVLAGRMPLPDPYPPQPKLSVTSNKTDKSFMVTASKLLPPRVGHTNVVMLEKGAPAVVTNLSFSGKRVVLRA
jgi:hypothetical protein